MHGMRNRIFFITPEQYQTALRTVIRYKRVYWER